MLGWLRTEKKTTSDRDENLSLESVDGAEKKLNSRLKNRHWSIHFRIHVVKLISFLEVFKKV